METRVNQKEIGYLMVSLKQSIVFYSVFLGLGKHSLQKLPHVSKYFWALQILWFVSQLFSCYCNTNIAIDYYVKSLAVFQLNFIAEMGFKADWSVGPEFA